MPRLAAITLSLGLAGCASLSPQPLTREQIVQRTGKEISKRETWAKDAQIIITEDPDSKKWRWKVTARALDPTQRLPCGCIPYLPGTDRELYFSHTGRLMIYQTP
jgi:hypothetical protein